MSTVGYGEVLCSKCMKTEEKGGCVTLLPILSAEAAPGGTHQEGIWCFREIQDRDGAERDVGVWPPTNSVILNDKPNVSGFSILTHKIRS